MNEKDKYECNSCNCVEVGTIIHENDTLLTIDLSGVNAQAEFESLKDAASQIGSGNCKVTSETIDKNGHTVIHAMFDFDCTVEKLLFQMHNR